MTAGSVITPTTALAKKILQKDFWRRGGAAYRASRGCLQNAACADDVTKAKRKFNTVLRSLYEVLCGN